MWECPRCGRRFARQRQTHSCAPLRGLDDHFRRCRPHVRATFDRLLDAVAAYGPVTVLPERSRIALQVRTSFAAFVARTGWLDGHVVLARELSSPRFRRVEVYGPRTVLHAFRLHGPADVDDEVAAWLGEAYQVGSRQLGRE